MPLFWRSRWASLRLNEESRLGGRLCELPMDGSSTCSSNHHEADARSAQPGMRPERRQECQAKRSPRLAP